MTTAVSKLTNGTAKADAILEVAGAVTKVLAGTTAVTNIAVAGAKVGDVIESCIMFASGVPSDVTSEASFTSAGNLRLSTTDSTGNTLILRYRPSLG